MADSKIPDPQSAPTTSPEEKTGIDNDPQYKAIRDELIKQWESTNGKEILSADGQDYLFGKVPDPDAPTVDTDAQRVFRERFPEEARKHDEAERSRIYENPSRDPAVVAAERDIAFRSNLDPKVREALKRGDSKWRDITFSARSRESMSGWDTFVAEFPEKAQEYARRGHVQIANALERATQVTPATVPAQETIQPKPLTTPSQASSLSPVLPDANNPAPTTVATPSMVIASSDKTPPSSASVLKVEEPTEPIIEQTFHRGGSNIIRYNHKGQQKTVNAEKAFNNIIENTVEQWNRNKNDPTKQIKGKAFLRDEQGGRIFNRRKILNPEVAGKIPGIQAQAEGVFAQAFGTKALTNYQGWQQIAPHTNPQNDPVLKRFETQVVLDTEHASAERLAEKQRIQGTSATLSTSEREEIARSARQRRFNTLADEYPEKIKGYTKRRYRKDLPWLRDAYSSYASDKKQQADERKTFYQDPQRVKERIALRTQDEVTRQARLLQEADVKKGIKRDLSFYQSQVNRTAVARNITRQEAGTMFSLKGPRAFLGSDDETTRALREEYKTAEKAAQEEAKIQEKEARARQKEQARLERIRDPKNDSRIANLRASVQRETEAEIQKMRTPVVEKNAPSIRGHYLSPAAQQQLRDIQGQRGIIEAGMRQKKYEELFGNMREDQLRKYLRKDPELKAAYQKWQENLQKAKQEREEAIRLTKKRRFYHKAFDRIQNPVRARLSRTRKRIAQTRLGKAYTKFRENVRPLDPLRNRYDAMLDWRDKINDKYNPYTRARKRLEKWNEEHNPYNKLKKRIGESQLAQAYKDRRERLSKFNQRYNPYEIAKRYLKNLRKELAAAAKGYAKAGAKAAGRGALRGAKALGRTGFRGGAAVGGRAARGASNVASRALTQAATGTAKRALLSNPFVIAGIVIILILLYFMNFENSDNNEDVDVETTTEDTQVANLPEQGAGNVQGARIGPGFQAVLQATDKADEKAREFAKKLKESEITYTIRVSYGGTADDIIVTYPIPEGATFVEASGVYKQEASGIVWSVKENQGGGSSSSSNSCQIGSPNNDKWRQVNRWDNFVQAAVEKVQKEEGVVVPANRIKGHMMIESGGNPDAYQVNPNGNASGLMQVTRNAYVADRLDFSKIMDPEYNIYAGTLELAVRYKNASCNKGWDGASYGYFGGDPCGNGLTDPVNNTTPKQYNDRLQGYIAELDAAGGSCTTTGSLADKIPTRSFPTQNPTPTKADSKSTSLGTPGTIHNLGFGASDATRIENMIKKLRPTSPMIGHGGDIIKLAREFNVDPLMIIVTINESQMCTDNGVVSPGGSDPDNYNCGGILWDSAQIADVARWHVRAGPSANGHVFAFAPTIQDGLGLFFDYIGSHPDYKNKSLPAFYDIYNPCSDSSSFGFACGAGEAQHMLELLKDNAGAACTAGDDCFSGNSSQSSGTSSGGTFSPQTFTVTIRPQKPNSYLKTKPVTADAIGANDRSKGNSTLSGSGTPTP